MVGQVGTAVDTRVGPADGDGDGDRDGDGGKWYENIFKELSSDLDV